jgi:hypothetical protein
MGTSTNYDAPSSWSSLKSEVSRTANSGYLTSEKASGLLKSFIQHNRGYGTGRRGVVANGRAARSVAGRLGGFVSDIGRLGLAQALHKAGWDDLIGRPVKEILNALLDRIGGESSTIDEVDARMALSRLQDKFFAEAKTIEHLEQLLSNQVGRLESLLQDYFGFYLFEVFCRVFFERLAKLIGNKAQSFLNEIGSFINATLENRMAGRDISKVDWAGQEGKAVTDEIMKTTFKVFGGVDDDYFSQDTAS